MDERDQTIIRQQQQIESLLVQCEFATHMIEQSRKFSELCWFILRATIGSVGEHCELEAFERIRNSVSPLVEQKAAELGIETDYDEADWWKR